MSPVDRIQAVVPGPGPRVLVLAQGSAALGSPEGDAVLGRTLLDLAAAGVQTRILSVGRRGFRGQVAAARRARSEIAQFRPGVILVFDTPATAPLALLAAKVAPAASVRLAVRGSEVPDILEVLYRRIRADMRLLFASAERIIVPSQTALRHLQQALRRPTSAFAVCPLGVAGLERFTPPHDLEDLHEDTDSCFVVGCVAPLAPGHGHSTLFEAFAHLARETRPHRLRLEVLGDGPLRSALQFEARRLGIEQYVGFFPRMSPRSMPDFLRGLHTLVHPTCRIGEGPSLEVLEAMACGVPVIASRIGAVREYIQPGLNGALVSPGSAAQLTLALREMRSMDPQARVWLARRAVRTAQDYVGTASQVGLRGILADPAPSGHRKAA